MHIKNFLSRIRLDARKKEDRIILSLVNNLFSVSLISLMTVLAGSILDGLIISNFLHETAFAAFGLSSPLTNLIELVGNVIATGCIVACGNLIGAGKPGRRTGALTPASLCASASAELPRRSCSSSRS